MCAHDMSRFGLYSLVKIPELSATMQAMSREMEKAGLVDEIVGEAFDALDVCFDVL